MSSQEKWQFVAGVLILIFVLIWMIGCDDFAYEMMYEPPPVVETSHERAFRTVEVAGIHYRVQVASCRSCRIKGLSGRDHLDADGGMLFLFEEPGKRTINMQNVGFDLDLLFILDSRVVSFHAAKAESLSCHRTLYHSGFIADAVLELPAGLIAEGLVYEGMRIDYLPALGLSIESEEALSGI